MVYSSNRYSVTGGSGGAGGYIVAGKVSTNSHSSFIISGIEGVLASTSKGCEDPKKLFYQRLHSILDYFSGNDQHDTSFSPELYCQTFLKVVDIIEKRSGNIEFLFFKDGKVVEGDSEYSGNGIIVTPETKRKAAESFLTICGLENCSDKTQWYDDMSTECYANAKESKIVLFITYDDVI